MERNILYSLLAGFLLLSCGESSQKNNETKKADTTISENTEKNKGKTNDKYQELYGSYVGSFNAIEIEEKEKLKYTNKINLSIDLIESDSIWGHSVVAGNNRKFKGTLTKKDSTWSVVAKEAGDNPYDGVFTFDVNISKKLVEGVWKPYNTKLSKEGRQFRLEKKIFKYDPTLSITTNMIPVYDSYNEKSRESEMITPDASKFNASTHQLTSKDVENMYKRDLEILRNTIYARHGYAFKNRKMRDFFDIYVDWYIPVSTDVTKELTDLEIKNIELIKRYEKHATAYYDSFGR
jgi:YARHG domain